MRIRLILEPLSPNTSLSFNYNYSFSSMIYAILSRSSSQYASFLHEEGYKLGNKQFKFYTFSRPWVEKQQVRNGRIYVLPGTVTWQISSPIDDFLNNLVNGLFEKGELVLADEHSINYFAVKQIETIAIPNFTTEMRFSCLAPMMVAVKEERNGRIHKHYVRPDEHRFSELIRQNLVEKYRRLHNSEPTDGQLEFCFDWEDIKRRGGVEKISKLIKYKNIDIRGYLAPFIVKGSKELIQIGYECGFGNANSQGFGMVEYFAS